MGENTNSEDNTFIDLLALLLVGLVYSVAVLFPENFISGLPFLATRNSYPLTLLLPVMAAGTVVYLVVRRDDIKRAMVDGIVSIIFIYLLARNISGPENLAAIKYFVYGVGIFYITSILSARNENFLSKLVYVIVGLLMLTSAYGLLEYGLQKNVIFREYIVQAIPDPRVGLHRIGSTLAHPVSFGAFLIQGLPFSFLVWIRLRANSQNAWSQALAMVATLLALVALFFTYSKGSWIVAVLLTMGLLVSMRASIGRKLAAPALVTAAILIIMLAVFWQEVQAETEARAEGSIVIRLETWSGALEGFTEHPLTGVGIKQGKEELKKYIDPVLSQGLEYRLPVDNYYLSLLLESGIIGLVLWLVFLAFIFLEGAKVALAHGPGKFWALAALFSMAGLCLNSATFESMHIWPNFMLFWISAGIIHGLYWNLDENCEVQKEWQVAPSSYDGFSA